MRVIDTRMVLGLSIWILGFALMEVRDELARVYAHVNLLTEIEFSSAKKG